MVSASSSMERTLKASLANMLVNGMLMRRPVMVIAYSQMVLSTAAIASKAFSTAKVSISGLLTRVAAATATLENGPQARCMVRVSSPTRMASP